MMRGLMGTTALAAVLAFWAVDAGAQQRVQFNGVVAFGDSLSDTGNLPPGLRAPSPPYSAGRFSNGPVWVEQFGTLNGISARSFANGGAQTGRLQPIDVQFQLDRFLAANPQLNSGTLYAVWAGANDFFPLATNPNLNAQLIAGTAVANNITSATRLLRAGARNVAVFNLPNLGDIPLTRAGGPAAVAGLNQVTGLYNGILAEQLETLRAANPGANIVLIDVNAISQAIQATPSVFGLTNVTTPCILSSGSGGPATGACATPQAEAGTLFFDLLHPTTTVAGLTARYVDATLAAVFDAPQAFVSTTQLGIRTMELANQGIQSRLIGARSGAGTTDLLTAEDDTWGLFVFGSYADTEQEGVNGQLPYASQIWNAGFGGEYRIDEHLKAGIAFAYGSGDQVVDDGLLTVESDSYSFLVYGTAATGPYWGDLVLGYSYDDYSDLVRQTGFAPLPTAEADTSGSTYLASINGGYTLKLGDSLGFGPTAGFRYISTDLQAFTEEGAPTLNLAVDDFGAESLVGIVGIQATGRYAIGQAVFGPHARLALEHEFQDDNRDLTLRIVTSGQPGRTVASTSDRNRLLVGAGWTFELPGFIQGSFGWEESFISENRTDHAISGRVRMAF